jgi:hypothetical protein
MEVLRFGEIQEVSCEVHPSAVLGILQHHNRRKKEAHSVGALLGSSSEGLIRIKNSAASSFVIKDGKVNFKFNYTEELVELQKLSQPKDDILGYYMTGPLESFAAILHNSFEQKFTLRNRAFLLSLDITPAGLNVQCYKVQKQHANTVVFFKAIPTQVLTHHLTYLLPRPDVLDLIHRCKLQLAQLGQAHPDDRLTRCLVRLEQALGLQERGELKDVRLVELLAQHVQTQLQLYTQVSSAL